MVRTTAALIGIGRQVWHLIFTCLLVASGFVPFSHGGEEQRMPNVVVLLADDLGTLDAGCYGSTDLETPAIDKLAQQGVRFTQAYAHTVCCPARAMLLTGRYPQRGGVNTWTQSMPYGPKGVNMALGEITLAEVFQEAGYRTALFGKWHLGAHSDHGPREQGFEEFFGIRGGHVDNYIHYALSRTGRHDLFEGTKELFRRGEYFPDLVIDRALSFIARNQDQPFFLYLPFNLPHYPEQSLARYQTHYASLEEPRRSYAAAVSTVDDHTGRIIALLETLDLFNETIVIFMSDNGHSIEDYRINVDNHPSGYPRGHVFGANGGGGNTGKWIGSKGSYLEGGIRVPAIMSYPKRLIQGVVRDQAVTAMDWFPTLLDLCGLPRPSAVQLDGHSMLPLIDDKHVPSSYDTMHWQWKNHWMVREGDWKLIMNDNTYLSSTKLESIHLANLADPEPERTNHRGDHPEVVERLTRLHEQWIADIERGHGE